MVIALAIALGIAASIGLSALIGRWLKSLDRPPHDHDHPAGP